MSIRVDAELVPGQNTIPKEFSTLSPAPEIIRSISTGLSPTDVKKLYFLCIDLISPEKQCPHSVQELLSFINGDVDTSMLLKELLYHLKKYRLLKCLQTCRHQMKICLEPQRQIIRQRRLTLFFVCENMKNESVVQLKCLLRQNSPVTEGWEEVAAEDFFKTWLREINDSKMKMLKEALGMMKFPHPHLALKLLYEESSYPIMKPSIGNSCGLAVIFNHESFNQAPSTCNKFPKSYLEERLGTNVDEVDLVNLWTSFGFDVLVFKDKTYALMKDVICQLTKLDYSRYYAFICCILTHGDKGIIYTSDNIGVDLFNEVIYQFASNSVPSLNNKPKMFFIQACQGKGVEKVGPLPDSAIQADSSSSNDQSYADNSKRDMLWVLSTVPNLKSFRHTENGSWFINSLVEIFKESGTNQPVVELLGRVNSVVSTKSGEYGKEGTVSQMSVLSFTTFRVLRLQQVENSIEPPRPVQQLFQCPISLRSVFELATALYLV